MTVGHPKLLQLERVVVEFCVGVWRDPQIGRLLILCGPNGTGKTHCAKAVDRWVDKVGGSRLRMRRFNDVGPMSCQYVFWPRFLDVLKNGQWESVEEHFHADVSVLDDVGAGHDPSKMGVDKLCQILSLREKRWTLVTTNVKPSEWVEKFDLRTASRFTRSSTIIDLSGVPEYEAP